MMMMKSTFHRTKKSLNKQMGKAQFKLLGMEILLFLISILTAQIKTKEMKITIMSKNKMMKGKKEVDQERKAASQISIQIYLSIKI